ncbi:hypothetical protein DL93DRAFT_1402572 [Clavulina sp. PMI_390]|nr:hypothetical protein DL93DRAFT_1402572 [Clavulina sp. PMI_390]
MKRVVNIAENAGLGEEQMEAILELASNYEYRAVNHAYGDTNSDDGGWDFFPIYSPNHTRDGGLLSIGRGQMQLLSMMMRLLGGGAGCARESMIGLIGNTLVYNRDNVPSPHSTPLALFSRRPTQMNTPDLRTAALLEARCQTTSDMTHRPIQLALGGGAVALQGVGGFKERDPTLNIWPTDPRLNADGRDFDRMIKTGHIGIAGQLTIDGERHLIWSVDLKRVKSHRFEMPKLRKSEGDQDDKNGDEVEGDVKFFARHTFDNTSSGFHGPVALVDNGVTLLRCGRQGVAIWDVDTAATHGKNGKRIVGEKMRVGTLMENSWRDPDDFTEEFELSSGSPPTSQLGFDVSLGQVSITG